MDVSSPVRGAFLYLRVDEGQRAGKARRKEGIERNNVLGGLKRGGAGVARG
jgi:hypothetical protein